MNRVKLIEKSDRAKSLIERYGQEFELLAKVNAAQEKGTGHAYLLRSLEPTVKPWQGWVNDKEATINEI